LLEYCQRPATPRGLSSQPSSQPVSAMPRHERDTRSRSRRRRSRSRGGSRRRRDEEDEADEDAYIVEILAGKHQDPLPTYQIVVDEKGEQRSLPHVCAKHGDGYAIRVVNNTQRHIACAVRVDGENALLRDGSLIVAPGDRRELPGYLVSKNFVGLEYVKEYRDFRFGKPNVIEAPGPQGRESAPAPEVYAGYGAVLCDVYEAVLDEEVDSDQELRGQSSFYRGSGINGSFEERKIPEGKKSHLLYSSVTVQGPRSTIANTTRGRWWVRGTRLLRSLEVRYREAHSLMLLGVDPRDLGLVSIKEEDGGHTKLEDYEKKEEKDSKEEDSKDGILLPSGTIDVCDLTANEDATNDQGVWSTQQAPAIAAPVGTGA